ncbi:MAG: GTP-binding protein [Burkholderiaceae bacterium]
MNPADSPAAADHRIPVYLLTGYLGSGKTSLLKAWLAQPALKDAALVINELGEVGLDNQILSAASESASLVANACVCCTGLPGLAEALENLFWARLERRIPRFPHLVIETTGLAEPGPVVQALNESDLLRERYRIAGVITCLSAATADAVLGQHAEARAQLAGADLLVITKTDLVDAQALQRLEQRLQHQLAHQSAHAQVLSSAQASLTALQMLQGLRDASSIRSGTEQVSPAPIHAHEPSHAQLERPRPGKAHKQEHAHQHATHQADPHPHAHAHSAQAYWWPLPGVADSETLTTQIRNLQTSLGTALLRLKGRVLTEQGAKLLQMAPFESVPVMEADTLAQGSAHASGLTLIVALPLSATQSQWLRALKITLNAAD